MKIPPNIQTQQEKNLNIIDIFKKREPHQFNKSPPPNIKESNITQQNNVFIENQIQYSNVQKSSLKRFLFLHKIHKNSFF